jgi:mediator of RNA polymerase II transcription subunit 18
MFEPIDAAAQREAGIEPVQLRARKEVRLNNADEDEAAKARKEEDGWVLYSYLKPESERQHPDTTVRPWAVTEVAGDGLAFASALGYVWAHLCYFLQAVHLNPTQLRLDRRQSQIYKRGYAFRTGMVVIQMFQQEKVSPYSVINWICSAPHGRPQADFRTELPIPAHPDTLWEVEVKTASPVRNSPETPLSAAVEAVLEVQRFMRGLLDLQRQRG